MIINSPVMKFVAPFILGIVLGWKLSIPIIWLLVLIVAFFIFYLISLRLKYWEYISTLTAFMIVVLFGILKIVYDGRYVSDDSISNFIVPERAIELKGVVADVPRLTDQSLRFVVEAQSVNVNGMWFRATGGVLVSTLRKMIDSNAIPLISYGREVIISGELTTVRTARNPGEFDLKNYLHLNNVYASFYPHRLDSSNFGPDPRHDFFSVFVFPVRHSVVEKINQLIGGEEAKFLNGLVIGERSDISLEVKTAFINSGVMHILAVSGLHVAIVAFIIVIILQVLRIPEKPRIIVTCLLLIYYMYLTGNAPSVARSVIMAIIYLGAKLFERKNDMYNTLALSALVLLLIDAKQLFQPGFQLSFIAVFSIIYIYPKIYSTRKYLPEALRENRVVIALFASVAVSVAAGVGTLPFTSIYFGKISLVSFLANLVIVPLSNVILALGMLTVGISYFSTWIASIYAEVTSLLTWLLLKLVDFFGNAPFAYLDSRLSIGSSLLYYAFLGIMLNIGKRAARAKIVIILLILFDLWLYTISIPASLAQPLRVTFLDVGQGDAIFLEFPDGKNMLVDGGPRTLASDAGVRFIAPYFKYKGITRINILLVSHPDADHLGGVPTILRQLKVDQLVDAGSDGKSSLYQEYLHLIDSLNIRRITANSGMKIDGATDTRVFVLNPFVNFNSGTKRNDLNNQSLVIKIVYGSTSIMLTGDAEQETEQLLVKLFGSFLESDVLKITHHGSVTGTSVSYLQRVQPRIAVISVGAKNKFHHPSPIVMQRLKSLGCEYYRTDESGAFVLESDGKGWSVVDWR